MKYAYENLGDGQLETLIILLCQKLLGIGVQGFSKGRDGGRDAKFVGIAELHPSKASPWSGATIVQAKHTKQNSDDKSLFSTIRVFFNDIVEDVINRKALLSVSPNKEGHLEFKVEILDEAGKTTSADKGHTYRKLLCIAFDMAIIRAHLDQRFPRFAYHDGVFEALDDRKKENLLAVIRAYADIEIQSLITLIDSDLPPRTEKEGPVFAPEEIILTLHDENEQGRLFRMKPW